MNPLLLTLLAMGAMCPAPQDMPPAIEPEPDPEPEPQPDSVLREDLVAEVPRRCCFNGCTSFAHWYPVLTVKGIGWVEPLHLTLNVSCCDQHRTTDPFQLLSAENWQTICDSIVKANAGLGITVRPPARHLTSLDWLPLTPKWKPFSLDCPSAATTHGQLDQPSQWVALVREVAQARACTQEEAVQVLLAHATALPDSTVFSTFDEPKQPEDRVPLGIWAWENEVDLLAWVQVATSIATGGQPCQPEPTDA